MSHDAALFCPIVSESLSEGERDVSFHEQMAAFHASRGRGDMEDRHLAIAAKHRAKRARRVRK